MRGQEEGEETGEGFRSFLLSPVLLVGPLPLFSGHCQKDFYNYFTAFR